MPSTDNAAWKQLSKNSGGKDNRKEGHYTSTTSDFHQHNYKKYLILRVVFISIEYLNLKNYYIIVDKFQNLGVFFCIYLQNCFTGISPHSSEERREILMQHLCKNAETLTSEICIQTISIDQLYDLRTSIDELIKVA